METLQPLSYTRSNMSRITKRMLLSIIKCFSFEALLVPSRFTTDLEEDIPGIIGALMDALKTTLLESAPAHWSPRKLIESSVHLTYDPATPTPTSTSISRVVTAEEEGEATREPSPIMLRLTGAREFEDEQNKLRMNIDATETKLKVERDTLEKETHIGAEGLTSQKANEGGQIGNIMEG